MKYILMLALLSCDRRSVTVKLPDGEVYVDTDKDGGNRVGVTVTVKSNVVPLVTIPKLVPYKAGCLAEKP